MNQTRTITTTMVPYPRVGDAFDFVSEPEAPPRQQPDLYQEVQQIGDDVRLAADLLNENNDHNMLRQRNLTRIEQSIESGREEFMDAEKRKQLFQRQKVDREYVSLFPTDKSATNAVQFLKVANANYLADLNEFNTGY